MKWLFFFVVAIIVTLLNASGLMEFVEISKFDIRPDFLILLLAFFSYSYSKYDAMIAAFSLGFLADISGATMGPAMLAYLALGTLFSNSRELLNMDGFRSRAFSIFFLALLAGILELLMTEIKVDSHVVKPLLTIPAGALYTAIVSAALWPLMMFNARLFGLKAKRRNY